MIGFSVPFPTLQNIEQITLHLSNYDALCEHLLGSNSKKILGRQLLVPVCSSEGIIVFTGMETRQIFSHMFVMTKSCFPLLEMK